jgi:predicted aminopeptidase
MDLMGKSEPIEEVLASPETPEELARRLELVSEARDFSIDVLGLPDNDSYRSYADLERDFVVWNVFATPEFSLQPRTWCYPVAGCVSYRGYFSEDAARNEAKKLAGRSYDVAVGGASAYSTLGRFSDPVLNTMMRWDDTRLVSVLFHELAHQVLYVKGDSQFNESFARAVEEHGVVLWLEARNESESLKRYWQSRELRQRMMQLVAEARSDLEVYYSETIDDDEKRLLKEHRLERLQSDFVDVVRAAGRDPGGWTNGNLNNARLVPLNLYEGRLPEFRELMADCDGDMACFFEAARALAAR